MIERKEEFQNTIRKLSGVINANIITDESTMREIHVLTDQSRHPKQISRDVQSIYAAKFGDVIDRKLISIAQIEMDPPERTMGRIQVDEVKYLIGSDAQAEVKVTLRHDERAYIGKMNGMHTTRNSKRLVVEATLNSLNELFGAKQGVVLEDFKAVKLGGTEVYNVALCALNGFTEEIHIGSAIVRGDEKEALVRATLDALNRRIAKLVK
ncbi:hypothetical protein [Fusibacter sp. JL216-2]|uniref:hypothetical protein n=1 Tax=Fusibacter sp. JL216-2 TaxID=3071453 RepID=UPI003D33BF21